LRVQADGALSPLFELNSYWPLPSPTLECCTHTRKKNPDRKAGVPWGCMGRASYAHLCKPKL
jgi:hypothetical protein